MKSRHGIGLPTSCGYQHCDKKTDFNARDMFAQSWFALPVLHKYLHLFFPGDFIISPVCLFLKDIISITNYDYDRYFSISAWGKLGGSCEAKVKENHQNKKGRNVES